MAQSLPTGSKKANGSRASEHPADWKRDKSRQRYYHATAGELVWNHPGTTGGWTWLMGTRKMGWWATLGEALKELPSVK